MHTFFRSRCHVIACRVGSGRLVTWRVDPPDRPAPRGPQNPHPLQARAAARPRTIEPGARGAIEDGVDCRRRLWMNPLLLGGIGDDFSGARKDLPPTHVTAVASCRQNPVVESAATEGDGEHQAFDFDDERFLSFVKSKYEEEARLRDEWTSAKKAYDACAKGSLKAELKKAYEDAKEMHAVLLREARLAYIAADSDAAGAAGGAAGETPSKPSKQRSKPNTNERLTMGQPCGCSCEGAHCGFDRTTSEKRYDLTTQRRCCNACRMIQNKAMKWLVTEDPALLFATRKACWLNQSEEVRELGLGGGRQYHQRKALPTL